MTLTLFTPKRRLFAAEVVQTSAMDCGPAALKCLLEGFGISTSYGRLREACQTNVDGTSIDTLEATAVRLGLEAEQIMLPMDHVFLSEAQALPALVVVRLPNGVTHFVVAWRRHGNFVQVMDPATGRRWLTVQQFIDELYVHVIPVPVQAWREWAGSDEFLNALRQRLKHIGLSGEAQAKIIAAALADPGWRSLAILDAATRLVAALIRSQGMRAGQPATCNMLAALIETTRQEVPGECDPIPAAYWSVRPAPDGPDGEAQVALRGAVLVRVKGVRAPADDASVPTPLSPELVAALEETPHHPGHELLRLLLRDGLLAPTALIGALGLAAAGVLAEALFFRSFLDLGTKLALPEQRWGLMVALLAVVAANLLLHFPIAAGSLRLGRQLELRLRQMFLDKIPRLNDRYFQSRLISDMAERSHHIHLLRLLPGQGAELIHTVFVLILTTAGLVWLSPANMLLALLIAASAIVVPLMAQPALTERDLRTRSHAGALSRFYLDALLGLVPVRVHGATRAMRRQHASLLAEWARAGLGFYRAVAALEALQSLAGFGLAAALVFNHLAHTGADSAVFLLVYWAITLPTLGQQVALLLRQYPAQRNITLRLLEPLGAPEEQHLATSPEKTIGSGVAPTPGGVAICLQDVSLSAAGHRILDTINLNIEAGEHVAIVGPSGAGKSSLVGLLLGWHKPASGQILVDGLPIDQVGLEQLRRETAWVDPAIQLWNRPLFHNLRYGMPPEVNLPMTMEACIQQADLQCVLEKLPAEAHTPLGEGGALLSGGEGQRVRFGRAILRSGTRLMILDEPFRGLDREQRRELLARARCHWAGATLLCITHDVGETLAFERALVLEMGHIVEDGTPAQLAAQPGSRYRALLAAETAVRAGLWSHASWRRLRLQDGQLTETKHEAMESES